MKIGEGTRADLMANQGEMQGEEFVAAMLAALKNQQAAEALECPSRARKEVGLFVKSLQAGVDLLNSAITVAETEAQQAKDDAATEIEAAKAAAEKQAARLDEVEAERQEQAEELEKAKARIVELTDALELANGQAESLETLKTAWSEKEAGLNQRIADLQHDRERLEEVKAKLAESEHLASQLTIQIKEIEHQHELEIRDAQAQHQSWIGELEKQLAERETMTAKLEAAAEKKGQEALDAVQAQHQSRIGELEKQLAEREIMTAKLEAAADAGASRITDLQDRVSELKTQLSKAEARAERLEH
ncbi:MAG: hypothetical protein AB7E55_22415 [Pigmentiphaga sp.]